MSNYTEPAYPDVQMEMAREARLAPHQDASAKRERHIPGQLKMLMYHVSNVVNTLTDLEKRLDPLLGQELANVVSNPRSKEEMEAMPPLAASLYQQNIQLSEAASRLRSIMDRLEI